MKNLQTLTKALRRARRTVQLQNPSLNLTTRVNSRPTRYNKTDRRAGKKLCGNWQDE